MTPANADRNLLLGILAYQNAFISKDQLLAGMQAWLYDKAKPLAEILHDQGALDEPRRALLDALVDQHVKQHGGDPQRSLQVVSSASSVRRDLEGLPDPDIQASIVHLSVAKNDEDPYATTGVGTPTATGVRFRILRPHAKGGLGEVFVAQDEELHREVALKEIQNRHADNQESRARFMLEAEITGGLEHPGIVPVYGLGQYADGRPFYAMRFIRGDSLQDAIEKYHNPSEPERQRGNNSERPLEFRKLLGRFIDVCQAMQYAHDRGVLHRDLKPGNIMLGKYGETLVVDWGLAKAGGKHGGPAPPATSDEPILRPASGSGSAETITGAAIGTPAYMSPEQAEGRLDLLGPATDIYSLGATLYALLTGKVPADGPLDLVLKKVRTGDIAPPRRLDPTIDAPLEAVCLKAMALRPGDRYAAPRQLADELEHWLASEPVSAWPEPITIKLRRWVSRHKPLVAAALALVVAALPLLTILILLSEGARVDLENEQGKTQKALVAAKELAQANKLLAQKADERREQAETLALRIQFEHYLTKLEDRPDLALVGMANLLPTAVRLKDQSMAEFVRLQVAAIDQHAAQLKSICAHQGPIVHATLSLDGKMALTGSQDKTARLWEMPTGKPIGSPLQHQEVVNQVALSADGKIALTGSQDKTARLWQTATGEPIGPPLQHQAGVVAVALSADGKTALTGSKDKTARLWETATGEPIGPPLQHQAEVVAVALSTDGKTALTGSKDKTARLWQAATGTAIGRPLQHEGTVNSVAMSADGKTALTGSEHSAGHLWDSTTGESIGKPLLHGSVVHAVAISADGKTALTGSQDKTARLWTTATGKPIGPPLQHQNWVVAVALTADGRTALTGSTDKTACLWDAATGQPIGPPLQHRDWVVCVALSADGKTALTGSEDTTARLWQSVTGTPIAPQHKERVAAVALSADGKTALTGSHDKTARLWKTATGEPIGPPLKHHDIVRSVALSANGMMAITGSQDKTARLWKTATGEPIGAPLEHRERVVAVALSADGKTALTGGEGETAQLWDTTTGKPIRLPLQHKAVVVSVALSADGKIALTGSWDKTARLWKTATGEPVGPPLQHQAEVVSVALSADGKMALTGSHDNTARLWQTATGKPVGPPLQHQMFVVAVGLSADGKIALTGSSDNKARLWKSAQPLGPPLKHHDIVRAVALSADGKTVLVGTDDHAAYLWNVPQPIRGDPERIMLWTQVITGLEVDELTAVRVLDAATWQQRRQRLQELGGPPEQ